MTRFDTVFDAACTTHGFAWRFVYNAADRSVQVDATIDDYPCILRSFGEPVVPLFDVQNRWRRTLSLYIIHVGFEDTTAEEINVNLEDILVRFIAFRDTLRRAGIECAFTGDLMPEWQRTDMDEYGLVINMTCTYSVCQS